MSEAQQCPECGATLSASAPRGLCPACLLKRGLETNTGVASAAEATAWVPPKVEELTGRFPELELSRLLGRGGMGAVYLARHKHLDRDMALKILPPEISHDPAFTRRFAQEAQAMARLNHPNIVTIYDFGQRDGLYFFAMEYIDGLSLRQLLDGGRVTAKEALAIVPQICAALQYAHDRGIVHRDIKPENILLNRDGQVKIADFGLAKLMGHRADDGGPERVVGTPQYMAPEQTSHPETVDHRADIYALGVVFYQMLTGELPVGRFAAPSQKVSVDVRLDEVVLRTLEQNPARRYQQASEVKTQVETIVATAPSAPAIVVSPPVAVPAGVGARLSRAALLGALWAPWFPLVAVLMLFGRAGAVQVGEPRGPAWWQYGLMFTLLPLGLLAPFGTTILGAVAVRQIRHAAGRLYGLSLAVFDLLVYPLLVMTGLVAWFWWWVFAELFYPHQALTRQRENPALPLNWFENVVYQHGTALIILSTLITAGLLGFLITRRVWRNYSGWQAPPRSAVARPAGMGTVATVVVLLLHALLALVLLGYLTVIVPQYRIVFRDFRADLPLITQWVLQISDWAIRGWFITLPLGLGLLAVDALVGWWLGTKTGLFRWLWWAWGILVALLLLAVLGASMLSINLPFDRLIESVH
jgi:predicted Ser/Thr protein kinase